MNVTEKYFVDKLKSNDERAFEVVYKKYFSKLFYFIFELVKLHDITENIIQETFLTLWKKRHLLKEDTNLSVYLFGVAKNNCLYFLRYQHYRQKLFKPDSPELNLNLEISKGIDIYRIIYKKLDKILELIKMSCGIDYKIIENTVQDQTKIELFKM